MPPNRGRTPPPSLVDYGVIGDLNSSALVSRHGSIDWLCWPRLDSPSVFAALLDDDLGGRMAIAPRDSYESHQSYEEDTNILRTEFVTSTGRATLTDFMSASEMDRDEYADQEVHRVLEVVAGRIEFEAEFMPRFNYAMATTRLQAHEHGILASAGDESVGISSSVPLRIGGGAAAATWEASPGHETGFVLRYGTRFVRPVDAYLTPHKRIQTAAFWRTWVARGTYPAPWSAPLRRSALALKLLTYAPTGALAAAVTTSLPETPGGNRNWDYRFTWLRDSSFALRALLGLGHTREARRYLRWLRRLLRGATNSIGDLRVCYGLEGETSMPETELPHLRGYLGSRPVRIGNAAVDQVQLDIYGSLADAIYEAYRFPEGFPDEAWRTLRALADHAAQNWRQPDHGIWEIRGPRRRYTHSALMCWVALDRAIRVAEARGHLTYHEAWARERDELRAAILDQGWDATQQTFVQAFDGHDIDASLLLIPLVGFLPASDDRVASTIDAIDRRLGDGPFIRRYRSPDGLDGDEGAFLLCCFWLVHALALMGRLEEAQRRFAALHKLAGPLGLFSEQVDPRTQSSLGNFPQALTHLAHINAGLALAEAEKTRQTRVEAQKST